MCDLVTDHHANATKVERFSLAFAEERRLEDTCRENCHQGTTQYVCFHTTLQDVKCWVIAQMYVCICTCENTYLVFAGWVEGVDNSSSSYPPAEDREHVIEEWYSEEHYSSGWVPFDIIIKPVINNSELRLALLLCLVEGWTVCGRRRLCGRSHCAKCLMLCRSLAP